MEGITIAFDIGVNDTEYRLILGIKDDKDDNDTWNGKARIKKKILLDRYIS